MVSLIARQGFFQVSIGLIHLHISHINMWYREIDPGLVSLLVSLNYLDINNVDTGNEYLNPEYMEKVWCEYLP